MADLGLIIPLTHELIPNLSNLSPAFKETDYDPGNKYSVPKDYGITSFYWMTDKTDFDGKTIEGLLRLPKSPEAKDLRVNFLEGGTDHGARACCARLSNQHGGRGGGRGGQAAPDRRQAERRHGQLDVHRAGEPRRDRLRHGLERRRPARHRCDGEEGPRDGLPRARRTDGVLGRQLGHPRGRRASGRRPQVDQLPARARGGRPGDELPPVPGARRRDRGRRAGPRRGPGDQRRRTRRSRATSRIVETPKSLEQRNRAYTEFKAA